MPFTDGTACPLLETQRRRERGEFLIVNQALRFELEMTAAWPRRVHLWFHFQAHGVLRQSVLSMSINISHNIIAARANHAKPST